MGIANAQRALNYIRIFGEFFSQPEYSNLVGVFGVMNEPLQSVIGKDSLTSLCVLHSSHPNSLVIAANNMLTRSAATSKLTTYSEGLPASARASISPSETVSPVLRTGLVTSLTQIGLFLTLTRTSPSTEASTMTRSRSPDRTEDPEAFGHNRHVDAGLTNWSTGMSTSRPKHPRRWDFRVPHGPLLIPIISTVNQRLVSLSLENTVTDSTTARSGFADQRISIP